MTFLVVYLLKALLFPSGMVPSSVLCSKDVALFMFIFDSSIVKSNPSHLCASLYSGHERFSPTVCSLFSVQLVKYLNRKKKKKKKEKRKEKKKERKKRNRDTKQLPAFRG